MSKKKLGNRLESLFTELEQEQTFLVSGKVVTEKKIAPADENAPLKVKETIRRKPPVSRYPPVRSPSTAPKTGDKSLPVEKIAEDKPTILSTLPQDNLILQPTIQRASTTNPALMSVPFRMPEKKLGRLEIQDDASGRSWSVDERRLVEQVTDQVSLALENAYLFSSTQKALTRTNALYQVSQAILSVESLPELLQEVCNSIAKAIPADRALLLTFDMDERIVTNEVIGGPGVVDNPSMSFDHYMGGLTGQAIREGKPVISGKSLPDPRESPEAQKRRIESNTGAVVVVPLIFRGKILGTVTIINRIDQPDFTEEDVGLLSAMSTQISVAILNRQLIEETSRRANQLSTAAEIARDTSSTLALDILLKRAVNAIRDRYGYYHASIFLIDETNRYAVIRESTGKAGEEMKSHGHKLPIDSQSIVGAVICTGSPVVVNDVSQNPLHRPNPFLPDTKAELGIPLKSRERVIGVLDVQATQIGAFTREDIPVLQTLADQVANAIENAHLLSEIERRAVQLQAAADVSRATSSILDPEELMQKAVNMVRDRFNLYYVGLFFNEPEGKYAVLKAGTGEAGIEMVKQEHKLEIGGDSMIGQCIIRQQAQISMNVAGKDSQDQQITRFDNPYLPNTRSELALPLISRGAVTGAMTVQSEKESAFSEEDITVLQTLADQLANALQTARLFTERQQAEVALTYEQYLLRSLMDNLPDNIYFKDLQSRFIRINQAQSHHLLLSNPEESLGKTDFDFYGIEHADQAYKDEQNIIQTGIPIVNLEEKEVYQDGTIGWVSTTKMPLRDEKGIIVGTFGVSRDITERKRIEDALANERNLLRTLIDNIPDLIYSKDLEGRFTMANLPDAQFLGTTPDELIGKSDIDFFPKALAERYHADEQAIIQSGNALVDHEEPTINQTTGETEAWNLTTKIPLRDTQGNIIGLVGIGRDITFRKRAEAERERLLVEVERHATQLQAASEVSRATNSILNPNELMQTTVNLVRERFNLYYVGLFLIDEADKRFAVLKAGTGEAGQEMVNRGHKLEVGGSSMIGWCVLNRQARVNQNITGGNEKPYDGGIETPIIRFANPFLPATRSELALPLISRGQVRGAMTVQSEHEQAFTPEDITVLQTLADQIAVAVDNANLFDLTQKAESEARQRLEDLSIVYETGQALAGAPMESDEIANLVARYFINVMDVPECVLALYNPEEDVLRVLADLTQSENYNLDEGDGQDHKMKEIIQKQAVGEIYHLSDYPATIELMQTMSPLVIQSNDPQADPAELSYMWSHGIFTMVSLPLAVKGYSFGVIRMQAWDHERHFTPSQINLAMTLANAAAVSLENARLYQEQRETAEKLREVDKMKSQFLANMSHELRTPLNSIIGFSRVILKGIDGTVSDLQKQDLTAINSAGQHLLNLINDILDISKIEAGKMELAFQDDVSLHDVINGALSFAVGLTKDKRIKLEKSIPSELPPVRADATRIRQVLINFLSNAAKFTEEGTITLKAGVQTGPSGKPEVLISVTDTGIGISQEDQKKLFLPFSQVDASATRKTGGSGLGLSISRLLIELHGGRVGVISDSGKGSTFYFTLPLPYTEPDMSENEVTSIVLSIDDDRQVISLYERYLKSHNYQVVALTDPALAVARAREVKPFAITLDVMMPNRSGWSVLEALKADEYTRNIPVIICSIVADQEKGFSLGAADYLTKPILEEDLVHSLDRLNRDGKIREVLAIDDDLDDLRLVQRILEQSGKYQVRVANGGPEGLVAIRTRPPHAIVLDLFMPGVDGFTLLETIRTDPALRDIPVIIFTAGDLKDEQLQRLAEFSHQMINKGLFKEDELLSTIERALEHFIPPAGRG